MFFRRRHRRKPPRSRKEKFAEEEAAREEEDWEEWEPGWEWADQEVAEDPTEEAWWVEPEEPAEREAPEGPLRWDSGEPVKPEPSETEWRGGSRRERPAIVATLLSRTPKRASALAVAWTLGILLATSAIYWWGPAEWAEALPASGAAVFERREAWRLLTAMGAHADAIHLLSNSVLLGWLIYLSHGAFGSSLFPWSAVPLAALSLAVTLEGYPPHLRVVGASGLLYLLAGSWLTLYALVERRLPVWQRLLRVVGFSLLVLVPTSIRPEVSYRAHGIGLFFGVCLGLAYFLARKDAIRQGEELERDSERLPWS